MSGLHLTPDKTASKSTPTCQNNGALAQLGLVTDVIREFQNVVLYSTRRMN